MDIFAYFKEHIINIITILSAEHNFPAELPLVNITAEPPRDPSHGDIATNAAMVLAKPCKKNPRELATLLRETLITHDDITCLLYTSDAADES